MEVTDIADLRSEDSSRSWPAIAWTVAVLGWLYYMTPVFAGRVDGPSAPARIALIALPGVIAVAALAWRHRRPWGVALLITLTLLLSPAGLGAALVIQERLARGGDRRWATPLAGVGMVVATLVRLLVSPDVGPWRMASTVELTLCVIGVVLAMLIGLLRTSQVELQEQRLSAELARADAEVARLREARLAERELIAREMHDVVAHRISLVAMHAGALGYRDDLLGDEAREAVNLIQANAKAALSELRAMLTTLRGPGEAPAEPQPTLAELDALLADAEAAGQKVTLSKVGDFGAVPQRVSRHTFRIVQEGLTNARKHAPGVPVSAAIEVGSDAVRVRISNPLADLAPTAPGAGLGLLGVAERVALVGGSVSYGAVGGEGFVLEVELPIKESM